MNLVRKILSSHLEGSIEDINPGDDIGIKIDQTLTHDALGTLIFLQFEAIGFPRIRVEEAFCYSDHNVYQFNHFNTEDHRFIREASRKYGATYYRPGAGICHQIHVERHTVPGKTLIGSDSHTPTSGGLGMIAMGAGGLDVAVAMGGGSYHIKMPKVVEIHLTGKLRPMVTAKDVILELLRRETVKGGVGKIFEYTGPGVKTLTVPERCTITNMGTELGLTTSIFPSDKITLEYMERADRGNQWQAFEADSDATYDERIEIDLSTIEPLVALPSMPDKVVPVTQIEGMKVDQVMVGSCTNGSYTDLLQVAKVLKGHQVHESVEMFINPSSKQSIELLSQEGWAQVFYESGVNVSESTCGACMGAGHVPAEGSISLRAINRNFKGRSGLVNDQIYLSSPIVAAVSAITGQMTNPLDWQSVGEDITPEIPKQLNRHNSDAVFPVSETKAATLELPRTDNMPPLPPLESLPNNLEAGVSFKLPDNITTDDISPLGSDIMGFWANIPKLADSTFRSMDKDFVSRAKKMGQSVIVGGSNYGQGSSREQAAVAPRHLGVRAIIAKSIARIHRSNLINWGIVPLKFNEKSDYESLQAGDHIIIHNIRKQLSNNESQLMIIVTESGVKIKVNHDLNSRERLIILSGGLLPYTRHQQEELKGEF